MTAPAPAPSTGHPTGTAPSLAVAVRLPNWVGDVAMALPALALLRAHGHRLHLFGRGWARDLLAGTPDTVSALPTGGAAVRAAVRAALRASGARDGLLLTNSFSSAWQMRRAGVRATGYRGDLRGLLLAQALPRPRGGHEVEAFWALARALCARLAPDAPAAAAAPPATLALPLAAAHRSAAETALANAGLRAGEPYSVLCPLAVGTVRGQSKQWPSFPLLARLCAEHGAVVACPGPGEEAACAAALPGATLLPGLGLGAYAAVLAGARRVVANDSGPMHLAAAVGVPVLGIFGVTAPARTRPWSALGASVGDGRGWPAVRAVWEAVQRLPAAAREDGLP